MPRGKKANQIPADAVTFQAALTEHARNLEVRAGVPTTMNSLGMPAEDNPDPAPDSNGEHLIIGAKNPNKKRLAATTEHFTRRVNHLAEMFGFKDPIMVLMEIANAKRIEPTGKTHEDGSPQYTLVDFKNTPDHKTRSFAAAELASYLYPKRKSVEVSGNEGQPISFQVVANQTDIPTMPTDQEINQLIQARRQAALEAEKTIEGETD